MKIETEIENELVKIGDLLPADLRKSFGEMTWKNRIHKIELLEKENKIRVSFYSDGLTLATKETTEKIVKEILQQYKKEIILYFEKKEKKNSAENKQNHSHQGENQQAQQPQSKPQSQPHAHEKNPFQQKKIEGVKYIIAVASGKGGVGKSTVSVNLATSLYNQGYKVGILDTDIYGPSIPTMLNIHDQPKLNSKNKMIPLESCGLKIMSFGFFAPEDTAVIWRGPMIMKALQQFFWDVDWGELDFLVLDLPPGTGDVQLTLVQSLPISGAVIVTTPQNVALLDAAKGISMFQKTEVPVVGVIENMSHHICSACGQESFIFGEGGGKRITQKFEVPFLGSIPLMSEICEASDLGEPLTLIQGHGIRKYFSEIAQKVVENLMNLKK